MTVWLAISKNLSLHAVSSVLELHCVVPENVRTPHGRFFYDPPPTPWPNICSRGYFGVPLPPEICNFLKGWFCSPTPCPIGKGFSLKHRCSCQVKPTTYLTSIESHFIVYNVRAIPVGVVE